jgi:hypothetical protein
MNVKVTGEQSFLMITPSKEGMTLEDFAKQFKGINVNLHYKDSEGVYHEWTPKKVSDEDISIIQDKAEELMTDEFIEWYKEQYV